jgi:hypothetical protein
MGSMQGKHGGTERVSEKRERVLPEFGNFFYRLQGIPEQEADPAAAAEEIGKHGELTPLNPGKEKCRTSGQVDTALDGACLQYWIDFAVDADKFAMTIKIMDTFLQIAVSHEKISVSQQNQVKLPNPGATTPKRQ